MKKNAGKWYGRGWPGALPVVLAIILLMFGISYGGYRCSKDKGSQKEKILPAESYRDVYQKALERNTLSAIDTERQIIERLGKAGYAAVDYENQIDMVQAEKVREFCRKAESKEKGTVTVLVVLDNGGYIQYVLETEDGVVNVIQSSLNWEKGRPRQGAEEAYTAVDWDYSDKGYLFFEKYQPEGYDGPSGHTALRVEPLDEVCREFNRRYLLPVGYGRNNMFITDWQEAAWGELNFYDLYEIMYFMKYKTQGDFDFEDMDQIRNIPEQEFEEVFRTYFNIDGDTLKERMEYTEAGHTYAYRPRGLYERSATSYPIPEVTAYRENEDGTLTLTVDAVWWEKSLDRAFTHEVTIRPLAADGFQYVSNRILPSEQSSPPTWYTERRPLS